MTQAGAWQCGQVIQSRRRVIPQERHRKEPGSAADAGGTGEDGAVAGSGAGSGAKSYPQKRHLTAAPRTVSAHCGQVFPSSGGAALAASASRAARSRLRLGSTATISRAKTPKTVPRMAQPSGLRPLPAATRAVMAATVIQMTMKNICPAHVPCSPPTVAHGVREGNRRTC